MLERTDRAIHTPKRNDVGAHSLVPAGGLVHVFGQLFVERRQAPLVLGQRAYGITQTLLEFGELQTFDTAVLDERALSLLQRNGAPRFGVVLDELGEAGAREVGVDQLQSQIRLATSESFFGGGLLGLRERQCFSTAGDVGLRAGDVVHEGVHGERR